MRRGIEEQSGPAMILQCFESYDLLAEFDPDTGSIRWLSKRECGSPAPRTSGHVSQAAQDLWFLYRQENGRLHMRFGGCDFALDDGVYANLEPGELESELTVMSGGATVFTVRYRARRTGPLVEFDPTPFVEEEDFDFGLFLRNVTQDPERRNAIYRAC